MGEILFFYFRVANVKLINGKKSFKYYSSNTVNAWKSITLLRSLRTPYDSMSWGLPGMLKSRSDLDVVSNR